jgi:hypothetical protein
MKSTTLFLALVFSALSFAQNWAPAGAKWHYSYIGFSIGYVEIANVGDTVIAGQTCQKLQKTFNGLQFGVTPTNFVFDTTYKPFYDNECDYLVGLEENTFMRSVQIWPNPSAGDLYIESELPFINILLNDATGQTIESFDLKAGVNQMHFPSLQSGTYFIRKDGQCVKWVVE